MHAGRASVRWPHDAPSGAADRRASHHAPLGLSAGAGQPARRRPEAREQAASHRSVARARRPPTIALADETQAQFWTGFGRSRPPASSASSASATSPAPGNKSVCRIQWTTTTASADRHARRIVVRGPVVFRATSASRTLPPTPATAGTTPATWGASTTRAGSTSGASRKGADQARRENGSIRPSRVRDRADGRRQPRASRDPDVKWGGRSRRWSRCGGRSLCGPTGHRLRGRSRRFKRAWWRSPTRCGPPWRRGSRSGEDQCWGVKVFAKL